MAWVTIELWDLCNNKSLGLQTFWEKTYCICPFIFGWCLKKEEVKDTNFLNSEAVRYGKIRVRNLDFFAEFQLFLKSLCADVSGIEKFLLINTIIDNHKPFKPFNVYGDYAIKLLTDLPSELKKELKWNWMIKVWKKKIKKTKRKIV